MNFRNFLLGLLVIVLLLAIPAGGVWAVRSSFPVTEGEVRLAGLQGPVDVYRDAAGVPHIYAASDQDLFFAQGYVHAQDRFWQMDFWRHIGAGRLAEMFGSGQLETDRFLRTLGLSRIAAEELEQLDEHSRVLLEAYAAGVNAYLADHSGSAVSLEYMVLRLIAPDYKIEPWEPVHSLTWAKIMAWDLGGNLDAEIERALLLRTLTPEQVAELIPPYPEDNPLIVPATATQGSQFQEPETSGRLLEQIAPLLEKAAAGTAVLDALVGLRGPGIGSNNWVISGERTASGLPILANDTHLGIQLPSIWYENGLHCQPESEGCTLQVAGFSFPGVPGVVIGHNERIAWGVTNVNPDVQDLYIERINPENPDQYEVNGEWVDMDVVEESLKIAGGEEETLRVRSTRHGPIISDLYGPLEDFTGQAGIDLPPHYALALRWTALQPLPIINAFLQLDTAQGWDDFRRAASFLQAPSQNLVYADVEGNIGYQTPGMIPIRANGDGTLPVPGWTDAYEWTGYIPFEELPSSFNPPEGYIATANNAVVGQGYPYFINSVWAYGFRARRIVDMIENAPGPIDPAYVQSMQGDNYDRTAQVLLPVLREIPLEDERLLAARDLLLSWDYQMDMDSAPAALFAAFWKNLLAMTFHDQLLEEFWPSGDSRWLEVVRRLVQDPQSDWWDDLATPSHLEQRDEIFQRAFAAAVAEIESLQGEDPAGWNWGDLHTITFRNLTLGESGIPPIEAIFNRGPFRTAGGKSVVNATGWDASLPGSEAYEVNWIPSQRFIIDLNAVSQAVTMNTTGQSGHAFHPHYIDMADPWRNVTYHPLYWTQEQLEAVSGDHLQMVPGP